jgi:cold shock protein
MLTGKVKWFNNAKGFGFIAPENGGDDVFVHYSVIGGDGYRTLTKGQAVEYSVEQGPKGMHAVEVLKLEECVEQV